MMKLYNTLTRSIEEVKPLNGPVVTMYTCGPTVYDYPHIGNWFTFVRYDLLVRALKANGLQPKWVMNITDVGHLTSDADEGEDKLEKGAKREGKTAWDVAAFYTENFVLGIKRLNMTQPDMLPRATEHIQEQIDLVKALEEKGYTYVIDDGVYYDTSKFSKYADFAQLDLDELQSGKRVEINTQKHNPSDFALWKFSPTGEQRDMEWDSPWGKGFPGWHLECSAMSMKYLGETMDIHSGGIDHIPVHHTNEIAQSEAVTGKPFAKYWMHTNHILIENDKISKSLGNGITLEDIEAKGFSFMALRLHILESHYRSQSKFSWDSLQAAQNRLQHWRAVAVLVHQPITPPTSGTDGSLTKLHEQTVEKLTWGMRALGQSLSDDLDTPHVLALIDEIFTQVEASLTRADSAPLLKAFLSHIDETLGLDLSNEQDITPEQKQLVAERQQARDAKDWVKSDEARDQLAAGGLAVRDTPHGPIWFRP